MAAIHYLYNRMNTYQLSQSAVKQEENTIIQTPPNNKYDPSILDKVKHKKEKPKPKQDNKNHKWAKFTYTGRETLFITKIFKKTNVKITFSANNTVGKLLSEKPEQTTSIFDKSGIYQLECPTCNMTYISQTGRPFRTQYQEHLRDFKYYSYKSKFAQHLPEKQHAIDKMENIITYYT